MEVWIKEAVMGLIIGILKIVDALHEMFNMIVGVDEIWANGKAVTLWEYLFSATPLNTIFWGMFILSIIIGGIFCIAAVLKNMFGFNDGGKQRSTIKIVGQYGFSIIGTVLFFILFLMFIEVVNFILLEVYIITSNGGQTSIGVAVLDMIIGDSYIAGKTINDLSLEMSMQVLFGEKHYPFLSLIPEYWKSGGIVDGFSVEYALGALGSISILVVIVMAIIMMIKRLFDLIVLFIAMPPVMATICYDDGKKFKAWREAVFSKAILAYGSVIAINVYIIICAGITNLDAPISGLGGSKFADAVFKVLLMIGGAFAISGSHLLIARVMGTSAEEGREMAQAGRTALAIGAAAKGAANRIIHGGNTLGRSVGMSRDQAQLRNSMRANKESGAYDGFIGKVNQSRDYINSRGVMGAAAGGLLYVGKKIVPNDLKSILANAGGHIATGATSLGKAMVQPFRRRGTTPNSLQLPKHQSYIKPLVSRNLNIPEASQNRLRDLMSKNKK